MQGPALTRHAGLGFQIADIMLWLRRLLAVIAAIAVVLLLAVFPVRLLIAQKLSDGVCTAMLMLACC